MKFLCSLLSFLLCLNALSATFNRIYEGPIRVDYGEYLSIIRTLLPADPVVVEAGGHYGTDTVQFAESWPNGSIYSFEPNPNAFSKLFFATMNYKNVKTFPIALAEYNGEAILHVCYGTTGDNPIFEGASSILDPSDYMAIHYQGPDVTVPCRVLDDWCKANDVDHVDFIWFDLEGMELQVLKSSPKVLSTVKVIMAETNFQEFRKGMTQYSQLKKFLEDSGFYVLCHSYAEGFQGNAIFVRKSY